MYSVYGQAWSLLGTLLPSQAVTAATAERKWAPQSFTDQLMLFSWGTDIPCLPLSFGPDSSLFFVF